MVEHEDQDARPKDQSYVLKFFRIEVFVLMTEKVASGSGSRSRDPQRQLAAQCRVVSGRGPFAAKSLLVFL